MILNHLKKIINIINKIIYMKCNLPNNLYFQVLKVSKQLEYYYKQQE